MAFLDTLEILPSLDIGQSTYNTIDNHYSDPPLFCLFHCVHLSLSIVSNDLQLAPDPAGLVMAPYGPPFASYPHHQRGRVSGVPMWGQCGAMEGSMWLNVTQWWAYKLLDRHRRFEWA